MAETKSITRDNMPAQVHDRYANDQKGKIPLAFAKESIHWDDEHFIERRSDGRTWIEELFGIEPSPSLGEFDPVEEKMGVFTTTLVKGIQWEEIKEHLKTKLKESALSAEEKEKALVILDLLEKCQGMNRDLHQVRLGRFLEE